MDKEIKSMTIQEISEAMGLEAGIIKKYIDGPLKEDIEKEKLDLGKGKFDPYIMDLIMIELEVDTAGQRLEKHLKMVRESKAGK